MTNDTRPGPQGAERILDILEYLADHDGPQRFTDLHQQLAIPRPVLSRLLKSLVARGYIMSAVGERGYGRGPAVLRLARGMAWAPHSRKALAQIAQPRLNALCASSGHTVMALHYNGRCLESVATATADEGLAPWPVGTRRDQYQRGPWGVVVLAERNVDESELAALVAGDDRSLPLDQILEGMVQLRRDGYLLLRKNHSWRIAVPLRAGDGRLVGILGMFVNPGELRGDGRDLIASTNEHGQAINDLLRAGMTVSASAQQAPLAGMEELP